MNTVFLDLEKTLIYSWDDPVIINESIIKKTLDAIRPDSIGIYSFAIYDNVDRLHFIESLKQEIESSFQINIDSSLIFTVSEIAEIVLKKNLQISKALYKIMENKNRLSYSFIKSSKQETILS